MNVCYASLITLRSNYYKKRGLALVPAKLGIAFVQTSLNKGGALLHVYVDGSVLLTHGGMEMGQGLHTKMVQVCSHCLGIPIDAIHISETSTSTVANSSGTGASASSDLYGMAAKVRNVSEGGRERERRDQRDSSEREC